MQDDTRAVEVTQNDVLRFLGTAFRNIYLPRLSTDDLREIQRGLADEIARALPVPSEPQGVLVENTPEDRRYVMGLDWKTGPDLAHSIEPEEPTAEMVEMAEQIVRSAIDRAIRAEVVPVLSRHAENAAAAKDAAARILAMRAARPTASSSGGE